MRQSPKKGSKSVWNLHVPCGTPIHITIDNMKLQLKDQNIVCTPSSSSKNYHCPPSKYKSRHYHKRRGGC